ncbi:MAG: lysozyme inhibitor LprI family protein [Hydrogenobaculum sp.]
MRKLINLAVAVSLIAGLLPNVVYARQKDPIDAWLDKCLDKHQTDAGMMNCTEKAQQMWNARLNKVYRELLSKLNPKQREDLIRSERNWVNFAESETRFINDTYFSAMGTMYYLMGDDDIMELYKRRALQLQGYLDDIKQMQ